ncbi:hypothetical protein RHO13_04530 [Orbus wheelerorum]|uniref:tetratricopeptide repeat protein n=1 Tax=Orbus wheelerorum TaxID=3074111 RepID=UPI00370D046C
MKFKYLFIITIFFIVSGCNNNASKRDLDEEQKIYINETTKNYGGLIELYKKRLKASGSSDNSDTRFKLAQAYYLSEDFSSAKRTLSPLVDQTQDDNILVLYGNILSKTKSPNYNSANEYLNRALQINPKNGEAYNLKGIIEIKLGKYDAANYSFNKSREMFYDENKVLNNLAMLAILGKDYRTAYDYLNILYNKGYRNKTVLYNLIFTLVKLDKVQVAKELCIQNKISNQSTILLEELKRVEPNKSVNFNEIAPPPDEMKKAYSEEQKVNIIAKQPIQTIKKSKNIPIAKANKSAIVYSNLIAVRSTEHKSFSRITLETKEKLNSSQYSLQKGLDNSFKIKLIKVNLSSTNIDQIIKSIKDSNRNFVNVTAEYSTNKTLTINIKVKNVSNYKILYLGKSKSGHRISVDFYLAQ